jgi:uncharacterized protein
LCIYTNKNYIDYFIDSFLLSRAIRYDIKGKRYIDTPCKYYFSDMGLRNALLDFRQVELTHVMENILYNYLLEQGYGVDVGVLQHYSKDSKFVELACIKTSASINDFKTFDVFTLNVS